MSHDKPCSDSGIATTGDILVDRAAALMREFPDCFWFWHPDAQILNRSDLRLVISHLREYGDRRAWRAAQELKKCL